MSTNFNLLTFTRGRHLVELAISLKKAGLLEFPNVLTGVSSKVESTESMLSHI